MTRNHFEVAKTLTNLGNVYRELKHYKKAKNVLERAVIIKVKHVGHGSVEVAITLHNLALAHGCLGEYQKASEMWERVVACFRRSFWSSP